ncbi:MAG: sulfopyruvate decarboxylase subunit alpha [Methanobacteriaceae archaeon]|nr:sulfopyruvate decarboxylase subunit alpha [Methanobacteriaceae archaeon]
MENKTLNSSQAVYEGIKNAGINFIVSVPCVNLQKLFDLVDEDEEITYFPVTREEEGIGILAGAYLAGKRPCILMQNSGLGNSVNALASLCQLYQIPLIMIMSHRGTKGEPIIGQVPMGKATPKILESLNIPYFKPETPKNAKEIISKSWEKAEKEKTQIGILLEISYWKSGDD